MDYSTSGLIQGNLKQFPYYRKACNDTLQTPTLVTDGVFGNNTLGVVNGIQNRQKLYDNYIMAIQLFYQSLNKPQFLNGWLGV